MQALKLNSNSILSFRDDIITVFLSEKMVWNRVTIMIPFIYSLIQ